MEQNDEDEYGSSKDSRLARKLCAGFFPDEETPKADAVGHNTDQHTGH